MNNPLRITLITLAAVVGIPFLLFCGYTFLSAGFFSGPSEKECVKIAERFLGCKLGNQQEGFYLNISKDGVKSVGIDSIFLHDITMDGVPEVWLLTEGCEADRMVLVYSLSDWNKELYQDTTGHSLFYVGEGYVLRQWAHMGHSSWYRLWWDGNKMVSKKVFEEDTAGDYKVPLEPLPLTYEPEKLLELIDGIDIKIK